MGYMFVLVMVIGMIYYGVQAIKDSIDHQREIDREYQRAYDIFKQYPHIFRNRLEERYIEVNEISDDADLIREKVANNKAVRDFQKELEGTLSETKFLTIWKQIIDYKFYHEKTWDSYHRITMSDLEYDMKYDDVVSEDQYEKEAQKRINETEEKNEIKDKFGEWF